MNTWEVFQLVYFLVAMLVVLLVYAKTKHWLPPVLVAITALGAGYGAGVIK